MLLECPRASLRGMEEVQTPVGPAAPVELVELPVGPELWERVFAVAPLVLVGTKEGDGYDFAPKHMAMPLGWEGFYCFVCSPRHATYRNVIEHPQFTVSFPRPDQIVESSLAAGGRFEGGVKPALAAVPHGPGARRRRAGRRRLPALPRVRAGADRRRLRPEQPDRRPRRRRLRRARRAARAPRWTTRISSTGSACSRISRPAASRSSATACRSRTRPTSGGRRWRPRPRACVLGWLDEHRHARWSSCSSGLCRPSRLRSSHESQQGPFRILAAELDGSTTRCDRSEATASATTSTRGRGSVAAASRTSF